MLFDLSMTELLLIGVVALVVIGPKDLPKALRVAGYWMGKARTLSREFQSSVEQMMREAELDEMRRDLKKATEIDLEHEFRQTIDPTGSLAESLKPPELPKLLEAEPPVVSEADPQPATLPPQVETATPVPALAPPHDAPADPLPSIDVTPAQAEVQSSRQQPVASGFPLSPE